MTARERLRQVHARCVADALNIYEPEFVRGLATENAEMIAEVIAHGTDDDCQRRVDLLLQAAPELFPS